MMDKPGDDENQRAPREPLADAARRRFLLQSLGGACGAGVLGLGLVAHVERANALPTQALRPPGAGAENRFDAACIRCGLCVRACPYQTLNLASLGSGVPTGTPYFEARTTPCEMCEDIPCLKACPTGALSPTLENVADARMGLAILADRERCLSLQGMHCDACYRACPVKDKAITMERFRNVKGDAVFVPTVHSQHCTGCGKCEHDCVPDIAVIRVFPIAVIKEGLHRDVHRPRAEHGLPEATAPAVSQPPRGKP